MQQLIVDLGYVRLAHWPCSIYKTKHLWLYTLWLAVKESIAVVATALIHGFLFQKRWSSDPPPSPVPDSEDLEQGRRRRGGIGLQRAGERTQGGALEAQVDGFFRHTGRERLGHLLPHTSPRHAGV